MGLIEIACLSAGGLLAYGLYRLMFGRDRDRYMAEARTGICSDCQGSGHLALREHQQVQVGTGPCRRCAGRGRVR